MIDDFIVNVSRAEVEDILPAMFCKTGDETPPDNLVFSTATNLETLAVEAGLFSSKGQAHKNGFRGPIPWGLNFLGTKHRRFWVWNPKANTEPVVMSPGFDHTARYYNKPKACL